MAENNFYFYVLECNDKTLYAGYTTNIKRRLAMHNSGRGAKYVRGRLPVILKYFEKVPSKSIALKKERQFKKLTRTNKLSFIEENTQKEDHSNENSNEL